MKVEHYCYDDTNEFVGFIDSKPSKGDYIRIHRPHKGMWSYKVKSIELIYDRPSDLNEHFLKSMRIDLINGKCTCKEDEFP